MSFAVSKCAVEQTDAGGDHGRIPQLFYLHGRSAYIVVEVSPVEAIVMPSSIT
jgi:hypothetical protein